MNSLDPYSLVIALNHLTDVVETASQTNFFKDYFMPLVTVTISAVTAYFIAIEGYKFQDASRNERNKADTLNEVILQMQNMQANLIGVKQNYCNDLSTHPLQRAMSVPTLPIQVDKVSFKPHSLAQLLYARKVDIEKYPWMNIASFVATYSNYNQLFELLTLRNQVSEDVRNTLAPLLRTAGADGNIEMRDIRLTLGDLKMMKIVDLTEKLIIMVDDLIITINDFLHNFPQKASEPLKKNYLNNYVYLNGYMNESQSFKETLQRCKRVDLGLFARIMKLEKEEALKIFNNISVVITTPKQ